MSKAAPTLPAAKDAETQVVGSLLLDPSLVGDVAKTLHPRDFTDPLHGTTFRILVELSRNGQPISPVIVKQRLEECPSFSGIASLATYLAEVGAAVATTAHVKYHSSLVVEASRKRRLHEVASAAAEHSLNGRLSTEVLSDLWAGIDDLRREVDNTDRFTAISAAELDSAQFRINWLIDFLLVEGQPCILAGPKKTLKTTLLCALLLSIATGNEFLGKFASRCARRVLLCSGESGMATLQETCRRISQAMGWNLADIPNFAISDNLPRLDSPDDLVVFESFLESQQAEVVAIDPVYLCMGSADSGNLFAQGELLLNVSQLCQRLGVTLILCHHTRKNRGQSVDQFSAPELEDIAWAGFQEFARQWLLVGRRERYEPGTGQHRLWLSVGGSAGHGGLWAIDVNEGTAESVDGRHWDVTISNATEAHEQAEQRKVDFKQRQHDEQLHTDIRAIVDATAALPDHAGTKTDIKAAVGLNQSRFAPALASAIRDKHVVATTITKGNCREYEAYKLGEFDV